MRVVVTVQVRPPGGNVGGHADQFLKALTQLAVSPMDAEILVVDDDEPIRRLVGHRLQSAGYTVRICEDGQEAADLLGEGFQPAIAILDVMLPRLDGKRLLRMIRSGELPVRSDLPVILLTSRGQEEHVLEGFESGADDYVTKPFRAAELLARVRQCLDE